MIRIVKICPECGNYTLDYKPSSDLWKCLRADCGFKGREKENKPDSQIISIFDVK